MRIGIYGGSFNPPHYGHLAVAKACLANDYVDQVLFVPTGDDYEKPDLAPAVDRLGMVKAMIAADPRMGVSDYEVRNGRRYTYQTLEYMRTKYPDASFYFLLGADNLNEFSTWKRPDVILKQASLLVMKRDSDLWEQLKEQYTSSKIQFLAFSLPSISSTLIRERIRAQQEYACYLPPPVVSYLHDHSLYQDSLGIST